MVVTNHLLTGMILQVITNMEPAKNDKHGGMEDVFYVFLSKEARTSGLSFI